MLSPRNLLLLSLLTLAHGRNSRCRDNRGSVKFRQGVLTLNKKCSWFSKPHTRELCDTIEAIKNHCPETCHACVNDVKPRQCTLVIQTQLRFDSNEDDQFECIFDDNDIDENWRFKGEILPLLLTDEQRVMLKMKFESGELSSQVSTLKIGPDVVISKEGIFTAEAFSFGTNDNHDNRRRLSQRGTGELTFLVVKVIDMNGNGRPESKAEISDDIFGSFTDTMTLKSQMEDCSFGKVQIIPAHVTNNHFDTTASPGVIEVNIDISIIGNSRTKIRNAATNKLEALFGGDRQWYQPYDHVMLVLNACYGQSGCGWAAYAYKNSWLSVYQGRFYKYVGVQMHGKFQDL